MPEITVPWLMPQKERVVCLPVSDSEADLLSMTWPSLLGHTTPGVKILLLVLGSGLHRFIDLVPNVERIQIIKVDRTNNPWQAVLQQLPSAYAEYDLIILRPGMEVPRGWDARLALSAYRQPGIAAAVPLCNSFAFLALFDSDENSQVSLEQIDRLLLAYSPRRDFETPVLFSGCTYLMRTALRSAQSWIISQPDDMHTASWCEQLTAVFREHGMNAIGCDHVYLCDHDSVRRQKEMAGTAHLAEVRLINEVHPLTGLRLAVRELLTQNHSFFPTPPIPVQLHLVHSWGGGLEYWVQQYCEHDRAHRNLVLRSIGNWGAFGQRIALYRSAVMDKPLRYWDLDTPIRSTALSHLQYRQILQEIITEFHVEVVLVSSLIGHSLDALATGLPTVVIAHDYYPFCPAIVIYFDQVCTECPLERLECCLNFNPQNRFFRNVIPAEWLSMRRRFAQLSLTHSVRFVAPVPSTARHWQNLMPELRSFSFSIIPHGLDFNPPKLPEPSPGERLRVVVLGSLAPQKGRHLLEQLWPLISDWVDLYLIGCEGGGETAPYCPGATVVPRYQRSELTGLLADIRPEVGLLLSVWPETFSYTLSELMALGIPVVATNLGSFSDRIEHGITGFLCAPQPKAIAECLRELTTDRRALCAVRARLADSPHRSIAEMLADYKMLTSLPEFSAARYFNRPSASDAESEFGEPSFKQTIVHIDQRASFSAVLQEFGHYVQQKLAATRRLRSWQKRGLAAVLRWILRRIATLDRVW